MSEPPLAWPGGAARHIAAAYELGIPVRERAYSASARGEQGRVWRLDTGTGSWAVKELLVRAEEVAAVRTTAGRVLLRAPAGHAHGVRVYECAEMAGAAPAAAADIGAMTARLHRLRYDSPRQLEAWFTKPLGEAGWRALLTAAGDAGASWGRPLARWLPDLIAADAIITAPDMALLATCHRD